MCVFSRAEKEGEAVCEKRQPDNLFLGYTFTERSSY